MKLEDQVCTLEQAKKLKELGVKQESLFYWIKDIDGKFKITICDSETDKAAHLHMQCDSLMDYEFYAAFTCAELGELLTRKFGTLIQNTFESETYGRAEMLIMAITKTLSSPILE